MANYESLKSAIQQVVKTNGNEEITGALLQQTLFAMVNSLGAGYQYVGIATPATNPGTPDQNVFYLAATAGAYPNFGSTVLADGEIAILKYNGSWSKDVTGAASIDRVEELGLQLKYLSALVSGYNGLNPFTILGKRYIADGTLIDDAGCRATEKMPLIAFGDYQANGIRLLSGSFRIFGELNYYVAVFFDMNGNCVGNAQLGDVFSVERPFPASGIPQAASFVAFSSLNEFVGSPTELYTVSGFSDKLDAVSSLADQNKDELDQLSQEVDNIVEPLKPTDDPGSLYIVDMRGYVIAKIDNSGIHSVEMEAQSKKLSLSTNAIIDELYEDSFIIADGDGNAIVRIDKNGLKTVAIDEPGHIRNSWVEKKLATYGDSITAICNGNFQRPYTDASLAKWANKVADFFSFSHQYGRGIGSTTYKYLLPHGGQVAWCKTDTGEYVDRDDASNYDDYSGVVPAGCSTCRGSGSSWLRIKTMFPASIKDAIDVVLVQFHNDFHQDMETEVSWIPNDATDPEWSADTEHYSVLGGDYNIGESVKGGIASVVMKLQSWMPNAVIVLMTPISGVYDSAGVVSGNFDNTEAQKMQRLAECVKDVAFRMSIPCIDVYGTDGINTLNRTKFISDTLHPYTEDGNKMVARAIIGGLMGIVANI